MVLRPPIARGLRFSQGADAGRNMAKAVIGPTKFTAIKWDSGVRRHRPLLPKQQIPMPLRQRSERSREGGRARPHRVVSHASQRGAGQPRWALSSFRCRPSRLWTRLQRSEHAKTLILAFSQTVQTQNEAISLRQTEQVFAPGMFRLPED
jgi:hypothetical protein